MIDCRVEPDDLHGHHYRVTLRVPLPAALQAFTLPVWIPGSYLVREFSRHLMGLQALQGGRPLPVEQLAKSRWQVRCSGRAALTLRYRVYAFDPSVRAAFLDAQRGFFNGTSLFLRLEGRADEPHRLTLGRLPAGWSVATAMRPTALAAGAPRPRPALRRFQAADYDELVDHPVAIGRFWRGGFEAGGVPHELVVGGAWPMLDGPRLLADAQRICERQQAFWHGAARVAGPRGASPFDRYVFLLWAAEDGQGGLEHRASSALLAPRRDLPVAGVAPQGDGYLRLLGLISHEYFHAWNVKRLKPAELAAIDYGRENHTRLLWFFEGFTSYYDDLMLRRAGLVDDAQYLRLLARNVDAVAATPGRLQHSLEDASFEAWTKFYRSDENTPNTTVSYYAKGALVALALDLSLRRHGRSLDALMRALWSASGGGPIAQADIGSALRVLAGSRHGAALDRELLGWVRGTAELPLAELLDGVGVRWHDEPPALAAGLGLRLSEGAFSGVQVRSVLAGGAAMHAGVSAGDELLAVDGWRIRRLDDALGWVGRGKPFDLLLVRDQRLLRLRLQPGAAPTLPGSVQLRLQDKPAAAVLACRRAWLDG